MGSYALSAPISAANDNKPALDSNTGLIVSKNTQVTGGAAESFYGDAVNKNSKLEKVISNAGPAYNRSNVNNSVTTTVKGNLTQTYTDGGAIQAMYQITRDVIAQNQQAGNVMQAGQAVASQDLKEQAGADSGWAEKIKTFAKDNKTMLICAGALVGFYIYKRAA